MKIKIRTKGIELTKAIENYLNNKANIFVKKYFSSKTNIDIKCKLKIEKEKHIAETSIVFYSYLLRGESNTKDMYISIDESFNNLEKQYKKHKDRLMKKNIMKINYKNFINKNNIELNEEKEKNFYEIIRRKQFILKPMMENEAIMQMELLGHDFYVYLDNKTNNIHVVYKRKKDFYGIIETKI